MHLILWLLLLFPSICFAQVYIGPNDWTDGATNIGIGTPAGPGMTVDILGSARATSLWGDGSHITGIGGITAYQGTTPHPNAFPIFKSASVSSGSAIFNLTNDGTGTGNPIFTGGVIPESVNLLVSDATASYQMAYAFSNSNKTVTVTSNKLTTANILTGILGQTAANGSTVTLQVWGYA